MVEKEDDCIFCKIVAGKLESAKIWENNEFLAILDVNPNTRGMTVVMTKNHYGSKVFDLPESVYVKFLSAVRSVAKLLEKQLKVKRVAMVVESTRVDHAHVKLYPVSGIVERFKEMTTKKKTFFDCYGGYLSTQLGPKVDLTELKKLAERIKGKTKGF